MTPYGVIGAERVNDIQKITTSVKYGKQAGQLKPLDSLLVAQL